MPGRPRAKAPDLTLTQVQVSRLFDVNRQTVQEWVRLGCPVTATSKGDRFDLRTLAPWVQKRKAPKLERSEADARRAKLEAEARIKEAEAAELEGLLVRKGVAVEAWQRVASAVKTALVAMPGKLAPQLTDMATPGAVQAVLEREIREVLTRLSEDLPGD